MNRLRLLLLISALPWFSMSAFGAATLYGTVNDHAFNAQADELIFKPIANPKVIAGTFFDSRDIIVPLTNGVFTNVTFQAGSYKVSDGLTPDTVTIQVPTNGNWNWTTLITNSLSGNNNSGITGPFERLANKGQANGYASLDETGKVPTNQLPALGGSGSSNALLIDDDGSELEFDE